MCKVNGHHPAPVCEVHLIHTIAARGLSNCTNINSHFILLVFISDRFRIINVFCLCDLISSQTTHKRGVGICEAIEIS